MPRLKVDAFGITGKAFGNREGKVERHAQSLAAKQITVFHNNCVDIHPIIILLPEIAGADVAPSF